MSLQPLAQTADGVIVDGGLQEFNLWMNGHGPLIVIAAALAYGVLGPIFVLVHELGHASVGLVRTRSRVRVRVGKQPGRWQFQLGRLDLALSPIIPFRAGVGGDATPLTHLDRRTQIAFTAAGPLASLVLAAAILTTGIQTGHEFVSALGVVALIHVGYALLPLGPTGHRNDGPKLIAAIRSPRALDQWASLFSDVHGTLGPERGRVVNAVPVIVERPGKGPDAIGVWKLAFAGWCWRAVSGDAWQTMRDAALEAFHEAAQSWTAEPDLTIAATQRLARQESPEGFDHMPLSLRAIPVDEGRQRWAFQFGLALYDIEMARNASSTS